MGVNSSGGVVCEPKPAASIYCAPYFSEHMLKINTIQGTVETFDDVALPETGRDLWTSGALATDNNIYYMPANARRILKLNPDNDTLSSAGDDLGGEGVDEYEGTVVGNDDCVYGIPFAAKHIVKFDPTNPNTASTIGEEAKGWFLCGNGVLAAGDGYIYSANGFGQVLTVDTMHNNYTWIGGRIDSRGTGFSCPIIGADQCIY